MLDTFGYDEYLKGIARGRRKGDAEALPALCDTTGHHPCAPLSADALCPFLVSERKKRGNAASTRGNGEHCGTLGGIDETGHVMGSLIVKGNPLGMTIATLTAVGTFDTNGSTSKDFH